MPKIKRHYYRRAKEMSDATINIMQNICNAASLESTTSVLDNNIPLYKNADCVQISNRFSLTQNNNNYQLNDDLDNAKEVNYYNSDSFKECDILEIESINHSISDNEKNNIIIAAASDKLVDDSYSFLSWLQTWAFKNSISHIALNELLTSIKPKYPEVPSDSRSLLKTPRKINMQEVPGQYYHFGLTNCIKQLMSRCSIPNLQSIQVNINIDGLPLFKSSHDQVYPILCNLVENYNEVNIMGIYYGKERPADANVYLRDFTEEAITLTTHGITINGHIYSFKINAFICDIPAKSFIAFTKGHSGYYSCTKCTAKGEYIHNRVSYPYSNNFPLRTNETFRQKLQSSHRTGTSILTLIPNLNMVDFPLDSMHLLYQGVVKKLLVKLWCFGTPRSKLSFNEMSELSKLLEIQKNNISCEINRKPRSIFEYKRWKATEFRTFLLYTGPVVLKSVLNYDRYIHFLTLHVAIIILSNSKHINSYLNYAKSLLKYFVNNFIILYGKENASINIHNLLHLCDDAIKFGTLEKFTSFPFFFENFLQSILKMIRKNDKVLQQIICRISEQNSCINNDQHVVNSELHNLHFNGPLVNNINSHSINQFSKITFKNYTLKTEEPDNCCSLIDGTIMVVRNFASDNKNTFVIGHKFKSFIDFYSEPCKSSKLGIYLVNDLGNLQMWNLEQVAYKCLKLKYKNQYVVFTLLHSK